MVIFLRCYQGLIAACFATLANCAFAQSQSLNAVLQRAWENSLNKKTSESKVEQTKEEITQSRGLFHPKADLVTQWTKQDPPDAVSSTYKDQYWTSRLQIKQPIYQGGSEYASLRLANETHELSVIELEKAKLQTYSSVSDVLFDLLKKRQELKDFEEAKRVHLVREKELQDRAKIGRSKAGELLQERSQIVSADSSILRSKIDIQKIEANLSSLAGGEKAAGIAVDLSVSETMEPLSELISKIDQHPEIKRLQQIVRQKTSEIDLKESGHYPKVDAGGNVYLKNTESAKGTLWDVTVGLTVPIYSGGITQSQVRESALVRSSAEMQLEDARRTLKESVEQQSATFQDSVKNLKLLREVVEINKKFRDAQFRDFRNGLINFLDALPAEISYLDSVRSLNQSILDLRALRAQILLTAGITDASF